MQRTMKDLAALAVAGLMAAGCGGDNLFSNSDTTAINAPNTYRAVEFVFENEAGDLRDIIAEGNRFELILDEDLGEFDATFQLDGLTIRTDGTFVISGNEITFSEDPFNDSDVAVDRSLEMVRATNEILLTDTDAVFDVDGDGFTEVAEMHIRLERL